MKQISLIVIILGKKREEFGKQKKKQNKLHAKLN